MTAGDRLPSYPRAKEEQFVSALDLMGLSTTILDVRTMRSGVDLALISKPTLNYVVVENFEDKFP